MKFLEKRIVSQLFHLLVIDTHSDRPDPDQHALDADPNPDPGKMMWYDPIRIYNTALTILRDIFALMDPDLDPADQNQCESVRSGFTTLR
jgi:hypothetical protein